MSQSSLERATRRSLPSFSHTPSKLSHTPSKLANSTSRNDLSSLTVTPPSSSRRSSNATPTDNSLSTPDKSTPTRYRSAGTTTGQSPHTPRIHYSPHATSTPREALSRSSSIPFDMAASAKAARKAQEETRMRGSDPVPIASKAKRLVRRKSLWQRWVCRLELEETLIRSELWAFQK